MRDHLGGQYHTQWVTIWEYHTLMNTNAAIYRIYSGKIWRGLKFGDLASSLKLVKFNSSPNFPPFNTLLAAIAATIPGCSVSYDTAQVQRLFARREGLNMLPRTALQGPQNTSLARLAKLLMNRPHEDLKANIY